MPSENNKGRGEWYERSKDTMPNHDDYHMEFGDTIRRLHVTDEQIKNDNRWTAFDYVTWIVIGFIGVLVICGGMWWK